jgi:hypothetical protein
MARDTEGLLPESDGLVVVARGQALAHHGGWRSRSVRICGRAPLVPVRGVGSRIGL